MIAAANLDNMLSWLVQVSVIAGLGALLPTLLRIHHPKSQLVYYHGILMLAFVLPVLQRWQHPLVVVSSSYVGSRPATAGFPWAGLILGIVGAGIAVKFLWLGIGLWQLRRYRKSAIPMYVLPQSIREARMLTGSEALFCISSDVAGPATVGFFNPIVLLPASFLSLDEDAQRSVACHELLHVRRKDWLVTLLEEAAGSVLWFHPVVWWLIARAKLTREQIVDAEVVRMNAPAPYIEALLSMAVVSKPRLVLPAAPFFTEGHLAHRMRSLLASPRRSFTRLCVSYASTAFVLALAGWSVLILFPLKGDAHVTTPTVQRFFTYQFASSGRRLLTPSAELRTFKLKLPPPVSAPRDVFYFVNVEAPPPPTPPPPGPMVPIFGAKALRPGQVATPEEVQSFIASFPERSLVEVIQGEDGTVQRVMVTRRSADETNSISRGTRVFGIVGGPATTDSASPADRVH